MNQSSYGSESKSYIFGAFLLIDHTFRLGSADHKSQQLDAWFWKYNHWTDSLCVHCACLYFTVLECSEWLSAIAVSGDKLQTILF